MPGFRKGDVARFASINQPDDGACGRLLCSWESAPTPTPGPSVFPAILPQPDGRGRSVMPRGRVEGFGGSVCRQPPARPVGLHRTQCSARESPFSGIQIEVGTRGIAKNHLVRYMELARFFHSPILRIVVDTADHHPAEDEIVDGLKALVPDLERFCIQLAIENHDRFRARTLLGSSNEWQAIAWESASIPSIRWRPGGTRICFGNPRSASRESARQGFRHRRASHAMGLTVEGRPQAKGC